jgi:hypothetical protein
MKSKSLATLKKLLAQRAAVGKQILATEKKLVSAAEAAEKAAAKPAKKPAAKKPAKTKAKKAAAKPPVKS